MKQAGRNSLAQREPERQQGGLPPHHTADEVAEALRTTRKAVYAMVERGQIPGVVRIGRRVLFQQQALVDWLRQKSQPSLER